MSGALDMLPTSKQTTSSNIIKGVTASPSHPKMESETAPLASLPYLLLTIGAHHLAHTLTASTPHTFSL